MGYTHYWSFNLAKSILDKDEKAFQKAIKDCNKIIQYYSKNFGGLSGYSAHSNKYAGIKFNGSERTGMCEDFCIREHVWDYKNSTSTYDFCKTARYDYDTVVVACLIVLKHRLKQYFTVQSDGYAENWVAGLQLAQNVLGLKSLKIPNTIQKKEKNNVYSIQARG